jgi:hypothetical protein
MKTQANKKDLFDRDPANLKTDKAAVAAIVQMAVNVELFTIPLYMTTLYSIQGMHQINSQDSTVYQGKLWPGLSPTFRPGSGLITNKAENEKAFNTIFSVFIEEMLHLQLASNIGNALQVAPLFTQLSPKAKNYAWGCYGPNLTVIPGIVDFKDCKDKSGDVEYKNLKVKLDDLNNSQNDLFLAIEAPEEESKARIKESEQHKYFPIAPFATWVPGTDLPMFGSIGHMYQCLWDYLDIEYSDGTKLFNLMYSSSSIQQDIFNTVSSGHPYKEFQHLDATISGWLPDAAKEIVFKLICAITDQGEGAGIRKNLRASAGLQAVSPVNQASDVALKADYPSFNDTGKPAPSSHAYARYDNGSHDHYERFMEIRQDIATGKILTWPTWHKQQGANAWKPDYLKGANYSKNVTPNLPTAEEISGALNRLNNPDNDPGHKKRDATYQQFCEIATGAIAGITTVLDSYWGNGKVGFPFPSMGGSGDRLMMCWAVFGQLPDLSIGVQPRLDKKLYHACQGLDLNPDSKEDPNVCASAEVYHNCRGSNSCKAEGGCGFVQLVGQSKSCGASTKLIADSNTFQAGCNPFAGPAPYSAPGDNMCGTFGGCAVPISASQIYPPFTDADCKPLTFSTMELNDFPPPAFKTTSLNASIPFAVGDYVYDIAWEAYSRVIESRGGTEPSPVKPKPSDIRIAFPPST